MAVQVSSGWKVTLGVITQRRPLFATVASLWSPVTVQSMLNQPSVSSTVSVNVTVTLRSRGAKVLLLRGSTVRTYGPISVMTAVLRGFGAPVWKSEPLTLVSVNPPFLRKIAVVLLGAGAFVAPSRQLAVPKPTRSTRSGSPTGQPSRRSPPFTRATLPVVPLMLMSPLTFASGTTAPTAPPEASRIR